MRIELSDPRHYPRLRDYFLRLGAAVVRKDGETIDVHFPGHLLQEDESPELYFRTWTRYHPGEARELEPEPSTRNAESNEPVATSSDGFGSGTKPLLRVGDLLVMKGRIDETQLARALVESRETGETVGRVLIRHGSVFESELAQVLAEQWSIPYVNIALVGVDRSALRLLSPDIGRRHAAVPVRFMGNELRVAFADPSDTESVAAVQECLTLPIQPAIANLSDIDAIWRSVAA